MLWLLVRDEDAQDLVEYALLCAFVAFAGVVVWQNIATLIGVLYREYNADVNDLWATPEL